MRNSLLSATLISASMMLTAAHAQQNTHTAHVAPATSFVNPKTPNLPILMLSDIHFDPFRDPTLVPQLVAASVKDWPKILSTPATPAAKQAYADLQKTCGAKASDTSYTLFADSLTAEHAQMPAPLFVTVSGDLMAHQFDCRFKTLVPKGTEADYSTFASNTVAFVAQQIHNTFPKTPIYFALGNNDSGCKDYREDSNSAYLKADGFTFADTALNKQNQQAIRASFSAYGDYRVDLPSPFKNTSLLVMQDIFESKKYKSCDGKDSDKGAEEQIAWLRKELDNARLHHQHIWVMAHVPPGVDAYDTVTKAAREKSSNDSCPYEKPEMFLSSQLFSDALRDYTDVITLALLGHTHMDEMRLFSAKDGTGAIPGKLVPSISPVDGNNPAFTIGYANPTTATLMDYSVFAANNQSGFNNRWSLEYTYSATYHQPDYTAASLTKLINIFLKDSKSQAPETQAYESFYFVSGPTSGLSLKAAAMSVIWPVYACSLTNDHKKPFVDCACAGK
jgi:sphingomyelin phosphodiesterase acid-like 3